MSSDKTSAHAGRLERALEALLFGTRWSLVPAYVVLCGCIAFLVWKAIEEFVQLLVNEKAFAQTRAIAQVLVIVDLVLVINLVLMILFVGYTHFVSDIGTAKKRPKDWPDWIGRLNYSGLKLQLLGSVIAVSTISILKLVVEISDRSPEGADPVQIDTPRFVWVATFHGLFLASALSMAVVDKLKSAAAAQEEGRRALGKSERPELVGEEAPKQDDSSRDKLRG